MEPTEATLCHPVVDGELLLIRKRRGLGAGKLVGPGGKVEAGETVREAARREVREEVRVEPVGVEKRGEFDFHFRDGTVDDDSMHVHVFAAGGIEGEPETTEEAVPEWHSTDAVPYDEMWIDDRVWLPHLVAGETFRGTFVLSDDGESLVRYEMDIGVTVE
ncbi:8-oxo-dGTP diphosphatase [Halosimplex pelagicum]|uniref:Oxidized purine nucleoside triphosphate hydrolase n=1 Tax=Halosimplex pelagicum TaxID=869886 RepID=A0A7D5PEE7_9EURY|nr:NUDIX domain-containing protein [Halosimplex pelagicum]QLH84598.1 NUDIX domain-containing protein [Halosimplex pelagicum]